MPKPSPPTKKMTEKQKEAMQTRKAVKEGSLSDKELKELVFFTITKESGKGKTKKRKSRKSKKSRKPRKSKRTNRRSKKR